VHVRDEAVDPVIVAPGPDAARPVQTVEAPSGDALVAVLSQDPGLSGQLAVVLSGLPPIEHTEFKSRATVSEVGSSTRPIRSTDPDSPTPLAPGGSSPIAGIDTGSTNTGGAGSSGSSGNGGIPPAVLGDPDSAPTVFALSVLSAPERRITWWWPKVVVGPG
jgi:hypothetical protein